MKMPRAPTATPRSTKAAPRPAARSLEAPAAATRAPTYDDLLAIARLIESGSRFSEFRLRSGDIEVEVKRFNGAAVAVPHGAAAGEIGSRAIAAAAAPGTTSGSAAPGTTSVSAVTAADLPSGTHVLRSPMVGTFYRAPEPGAAPFVQPGRKVKPDTIVCIIEVMKLMNSITAGVRGVVTHVLAENAHAVEAGQPIIAIRPE